MITRRSFIEIVASAFGAAVALHPTLTSVTPVALQPDVVIKRETIRNGLEILYDTQPLDADYFQATLLWWKDNQFYARRKVIITRFTVKVACDKVKSVLDEIVKKEVVEFEKEVAFYIANQLPQRQVIIE